MDPVTEARVVRAADRLISGRTGILVAHRLSTTERAEQVAVLESGRVVQQGPRARLAAEDGPFRDLLDAAAHEAVVEEHHHDDATIGSVRRSTTPPAPPELAPTPSLARQVLHTISIAAAVGPARSGPVPRLLADRCVRRGHRLGVGPHRHRPAGGRAPRAPGRRPRRLAPRRPAAARPGVPHLPALVGRGTPARARRGAPRADVAAPAAAHARPARSSPARWTPTGSRATPTAGSTSSTD